jgi:hypothetical protein
VRNLWPDNPGPYIAGSWELFPTVAWESSYVVPVGEDLNASTVLNPGAANGGDAWIPFEYTFVFFTVEESNTRVVVTEPGGAVRYNQVLGEGQSGGVLRIPHGTTVVGSDATTGEPRGLQAGIITSVNEVYDTRYYTLTPDAFLGNDYYLPVPTMRAYFYDPEIPGQQIVTGAFVYPFQANTDIRIETAAGTQTINIPNSGQVYHYVMPEAPAGVFEGPFAARISTVDPADKIWVVVAGDEEGVKVDWGYQALDVNLLERNYFLPFAPANPAFITPIADGTTFYVDYNNDNIPDETFVLDRLHMRMVYPPVGTLDNTGSHIYADHEFVMAWGQDQSQDTPGERASNPLGADLDFGYTVLPLRWFEPRLTINHTLDPGLMPVGGGSAGRRRVLGPGRRRSRRLGRRLRCGR